MPARHRERTTGRRAGSTSPRIIPAATVAEAIERSMPPVEHDERHADPERQHDGLACG